MKTNSEIIGRLFEHIIEEINEAEEHLKEKSLTLAEVSWQNAAGMFQMFIHVAYELQEYELYDELRIKYKERMREFYDLMKIKICP